MLPASFEEVARLPGPSGAESAVSEDASTRRRGRVERTVSENEVIANGEHEANPSSRGCSRAGANADDFVHVRKRNKPRGAR